LYALINLVDYNKRVAELVSSEFRHLSRSRQFEHLKKKCSADMFVCVKNIFANESLDTILLNEYAEIDESYQEYYRYVAALEAVGTRVHRQLLIRMLGMRPDQIAHILLALTGIVDEYDIKPEQGIFGWSTRNLVIARKIMGYKFSHVDEVISLFEGIIGNVNPAIPLELQTIRDICDVDYGIGRIADCDVRKRLYRRLIDIAPAERIPWHRLIRQMLEGGADEEAEIEFAIKRAEEAVGNDGPLDRYKVRLLVSRADQTVGITRIDRIALLRKACELSLGNIEKHSEEAYPPDSG
jgi:hypothetical protein